MLNGSVDLRDAAQAGAVVQDGALPAAERGPGCSACRRPAALRPFTMAFQPIVDVVERRIVGHEALVRGMAGEGAGTVLGMVDPETMYAFDQACRVKAIELASALGLPGRLSINFLPNAVYEPRACIRATLEAASRSGFDTSRLTFEIVETEEVAESGHLARIVAEYKRQGFMVALDDFATGYSGLARLIDLAPDIIKLDRHVIAGCDTSPVRLAVTASVLAMAKAIGAMVVLEGVETEAEAAALESVGGRHMQGFLFSRPVFEGYAREADVFAL